MSDVQKTEGSAAEPTADSMLGPRRLIAFAISIILGMAVVAVGILAWLKTDLGATIPLSGLFPVVPLWPLAGLPMSLFFLIWIDYFMGTKIVVD
jgi:hypothetical protein